MANKSANRNQAYFHGTEAERLAFKLPAVGKRRYRWIEPDGSVFESIGDDWYQLSFAGASKAAMIAASGGRVADDAHSRVHQGVMYTASYRAAALADDGELDMVITTPADDWPHLTISPAIDGVADFDFYEAAQITGGTAVSSHNHNRNSSNTFGGSIVHSPTVSSAGDPLLIGYVIPGGRGPHSAGASGGFGLEWALKASTSYLVRLTNRAGGVKRASIVFNFYSAPQIGAS